MTPAEYDALIEKFRANRQKVKDDRAKRYESNTDVLSFFKDCVAGTRLTPLEAWMFMFMKHVTSSKRLVARMSEDEEFMPSAPPGESDPFSFFSDLANYIELGYALMVEECEDRDPLSSDKMDNLSPDAIRAKMILDGYPREQVSQVHEHVVKQPGILGDVS